MNSDRPPNPGIAHLVLVNSLRKAIKEKDETIAKLEARLAPKAESAVIPRSEECDECVGTLYPDNGHSTLCRAHLERHDNRGSETIAKLEAQLARRADGLVMAGWWCTCGIFNGEEKEKRNECRSCGILKPEMTYP